MVRGDFDSLHDSNFQDKKSRQDINQRRNFQSFTNPLPHKNSSLVLNADSTREASAYNNTKNRRKGTKHGFDGMRYDSASNPSDHYEKNNLVVKQTNSLLHGYENNSLKNVQRGEYVKSKPSNLVHKSIQSTASLSHKNKPIQSIKPNIENITNYQPIIHN